MSITNVDKPTSSVTNTTKINIGETWGSITTSWATETRQWSQFASLLTNNARQSSTIVNTSKPA